MKIECPKCHKRYNVEDAYIPIGGAPIKCPSCGNIFGIYVEPIDIPMSPIEDDAPQAVEETTETAPEPPRPETEPISTPPAPEQPSQTNPMIDHSFGMAEPEPKPESPDLGALGTLGQEGTTPEQATPDLGSMMSDKPTETPDLGGFGQQKEVPSPEPAAFDADLQPETPSSDLGSMMQDQVSEAPDLGGFGSQTQETPEETPPADLGSMMNEQPTETPDLGGFGQQEEAPSPDLGAFGAQPDMQQPTPEAAPQAEMNIPAPEPEPVQKEEDNEAAAGKRKVGGTLFESLLAGFTLPSNFKSLPENVQKNHKSAVKLARQLAKDILLYHKDEVERGLQGGNIKDILKDEIEKSYKFYSQRVEPDILENANYFTEALNKIIAKGNQMF